MTNVLKKTILSIIPLYISAESSAFQQIIKAIEDIPDEKFVELKDQQSSTIHHRINFLIDEIIFFINRYYPITKEQGVQLDVLLNEIKRISLDLILNIPSRLSLKESLGSPCRESLKYKNSPGTH